jgi:hypothetical protein
MQGFPVAGHKPGFFASAASFGSALQGSPVPAVPWNAVERCPRDAPVMHGLCSVARNVNSPCVLLASSNVGN